MPYQVGTFAGGEKKMRALRDLADLAGFRQAYLDALDCMIERLQDDPKSLGDPLHRTKLGGGMVFHALTAPIGVRYAVYD